MKLTLLLLAAFAAGIASTATAVWLVGVWLTTGTRLREIYRRERQD